MITQGIKNWFILLKDQPQVCYDYYFIVFYLKLNGTDFFFVCVCVVFDSDAYSSTDNLPENVALTSPVFDVRGLDFATTSVVVDWDQYFVEGYEAKIFVEVWNGRSWMEIYSETATTFNPDHQIVDITSYVQGAHNDGVESRVRFRWTGM